MKAIVAANLSSNILARKNLLLALQRQGWTVTAAGCVDHGVEELQAMGVGFIPIPMENKGTALWADLVITSYSIHYTKLYELIGG